MGRARLPQQDDDHGTERPRLDREPRPPALPGRCTRHEANLSGNNLFVLYLTYIVNETVCEDKRHFQPYRLVGRTVDVAVQPRNNNP